MELLSWNGKMRVMQTSQKSLPDLEVDDLAWAGEAVATAPYAVGRADQRQKLTKTQIRPVFDLHALRHACTLLPFMRLLLPGDGRGNYLFLAL